MSRGFRLSSLLRARQAQEDVAKGAVARARTAKETARRAAAASEAALHGTTLPPAGTAHAIIAAISAQRAMAAALAAARQTALDSERHHADSMDGLAVAASRRRTVERLAERHAEDLQRADLVAEQRAIDEIAARYRADLGVGETA
jgi:flagellar export protein FliJ